MNKCCLVGKLQCCDYFAGLLATVPANPNNGANGSNVGGFNTAVSTQSEFPSIQEGTSQTGMKV